MPGHTAKLFCGFRVIASKHLNIRRYIYIYRGIMYITHLQHSQEFVWARGNKAIPMDRKIISSIKIPMDGIPLRKTARSYLWQNTTWYPIRFSYHVWFNPQLNLSISKRPSIPLYPTISPIWLLSYLNLHFWGWVYTVNSVNSISKPNWRIFTKVIISYPLISHINQRP